MGGSVELTKDLGTKAISSIGSILEPVEVQAATKNVTIGNFVVQFNDSTGTITKYVSGAGDLVIPEKINGVSVKTIGQTSFSDCTGITSVYIPEGVTRIEDEAFHFCSGIESVYIPSTVKYIGFTAFCMCHRLEYIYYGGTESQWDYIGLNMSTISDSTANNSKHYGYYRSGEYFHKYFLSATVIYNSSEEDLANKAETSTTIWVTVPGVEGGKLRFDTSTGMIVGAENTITTADIPDYINGIPVVGILEGVFEINNSLTSVTIPYGVAEIPESLFYGCTNLKYVYLPETIRKIGKNAFYNCPKLEIVEFGGSEWDWNKDVVIDKTGNDALFNAEMIFVIISSVEVIIDDVYTNIFYNEYLPKIFSTHSLMVSGKLPDGLGLYSDGRLYGIPTQTGTYSFIILNEGVYINYNVTVKEPESNNLETTNKYEITTMLPDILSNTSDYLFTIDRERKYFLELYVNGNRLVEGVDYVVTGTSNTSITIYASYLTNLNKGSNIVTAIFDTDDDEGGFGGLNTGSSSQLFDKEIEQLFIPSMPFKDVEIESWYYNTLEYLYKLNIFKGSSDTEFSPNDAMTRAELVVVLYRMNGVNPTVLRDSFTDVKSSDWYADAVLWAKDAGIVYGTGDGTTFSPNDPVTKEDMATIINRYCLTKDIQISSNTTRVVADINAVSDYAKEHVNKMYQGGILNTDANNNFSPKITTSRADAAYIIGNFLLKS